MQRRFDIRRITRVDLLAAAIGLVTSVLWLTARSGGAEAGIVRRATGTIPDNARGLGGLVAAVDRLTTPAMVAVATVVPLAILGGLVGILFGARSGLKLVLIPLGVLIAVGTVKGIVA